MTRYGITECHTAGVCAKALGAKGDQAKLKTDTKEIHGGNACMSTLADTSATLKAKAKAEQPTVRVGAAPGTTLPTAKSAADQGRRPKPG
ncbi:MAG: hypothetical protein EOP79_12535 [Variovorax sp.]|nr:MAG: hypothetical protein EOP79_12535 [Variovorax sp.]